MSCPYMCTTDGFGDVFDSAGDSGIASGAGVDDEIVGAELGSADEFVAEGFDGVLPLARIGRGQIDQIVGMDSDGAEMELGAAFTEAFGDRRRDVALVRTWPHARAGRENLERGAADAGGNVERAGGFACDGGVDADAGASVEPNRLRRGGRRRGLRRYTSILRDGSHF